MSARPAGPALSWGNRLTLLASSFFGLGYLPFAPGTWGTLGALPLGWGLAQALPWGGFLAVTCFFTVFAVWVAEGADRIYPNHDAGHIVIDEVAGLLFTMVGVPWQWPQVVAGFVLFRLLDMFKPPPIRFFDRQVRGGLGVVLDDVVAGMLACALLHGARLCLGGWW